eukprot:RCo005358
MSRLHFGQPQYPSSGSEDSLAAALHTLSLKSTPTETFGFPHSLTLDTLSSLSTSGSTVTSYEADIPSVGHPTISSVPSPLATVFPSDSAVPIIPGPEPHSSSAVPVSAVPSPA